MIFFIATLLEPDVTSGAARQKKKKKKIRFFVSFSKLEISRQSFAGKILINGLYYQTQKSTIAKLLKVAKLE